MELGWRADVDAPPVTTPDGDPLARQAFLRLDVRGAWTVPSPEPTASCVVLWTWDAPPRELPDGSPRLPEGVTRAWRFRPAEATRVQSSCPLEVPEEALVGGDVLVGVGPSPYGRWQDAVAALPPELVPPDAETWPWLDSSHVLGAQVRLLSEGDDVLAGQEGVGIALRTGPDGRLDEGGGGLLQTVLATDALAVGAPAYLRVATLRSFPVRYPVTE